METDALRLLIMENKMPPTVVLCYVDTSRQRKKSVILKLCKERL